MQSKAPPRPRGKPLRAPRFPHARPTGQPIPRGRRGAWAHGLAPLPRCPSRDAESHTCQRPRTLRRGPRRGPLQPSSPRGQLDGRQQVAESQRHGPGSDRRAWRCTSSGLPEPRPRPGQQPAPAATKPRTRRETVAYWRRRRRPLCRPKISHCLPGTPGEGETRHANTAVLASTGPREGQEPRAQRMPPSPGCSEHGGGPQSRSHPTDPETHPRRRRRKGRPRSHSF